VRSWISCGVVLVALLATGCSGSEGEGTDDSADISTSTGNAPGADWATPDGTVPSSSVNRPSELTVDDVSPCDLLTEDQRAELGLTGEQISEFSSTWGNDTCKTRDVDKVLSASVTAVSNDGIDVFYLGRFTNMQYQTTDVQGFPALYYRFDNVEHACYLAVDIADGQLLDIAFGATDPDSSDASLDEMCATAHRVTEAAVDTLLATR
jgi:hypothetical protein